MLEFTILDGAYAIRFKSKLIYTLFITYPTSIIRHTYCRYLILMYIMYDFCPRLLKQYNSTFK